MMNMQSFWGLLHTISPLGLVVVCVVVESLASATRVCSFVLCHGMVHNDDCSALWAVLGGVGDHFDRLGRTDTINATLSGIRAQSCVLVIQSFRANFLL